MISKEYNKLAIAYKEEKYTYSDLRKHIKSASKNYSVTKGDKVALVAENSPKWIFAFYSVWLNDAIPVPIDYLSSPEEISHILNDCKPSAILFSKETEGKIDEAISLADHKIKKINIDEIDYSIDDQFDYDFNYSPEDTAVIIYTSGTTGTPKGVMLSFKNIIMNIIAVSETHRIITGDENLISILPFHHTFPLVGNIIAPYKVGSQTALTPSLSSEDIIKTLQDNDITVMISVPRFYDLVQKGIRKKIDANKVAYVLYKIAKKIKSKSFSKKIFKKIHDNFGGKVKTMVSGGAALDPAVCDDFVTWGFDILEGYGMTECAPMITFTRPEDIVVKSAGKVIGGGEIKISEDGEITYRGDNVMKGYYNNPVATAEMIKDGWLYTGDLGSLDGNGNLYITGRKKDIIVLSNGKNINPTEIEDKILKSCDAIKEIGVFNTGDVLQAVIFVDNAVLRNKNISDIQAHYDSIVAEINSQLSSYKKIARIIISPEELPKTRLSKIQRFKLAEFAQNPAKKKTVKEPDNKSYKILKDYLQKLKSQDISPTDDFDFDLGIDSLDKVNLLVFIQNSFGIELQTADFEKFKNLEDLSNYVETNKTKSVVEEINWSKILSEKLDVKMPKSWFTQSLFIKFSKPFVHLYFRITSEGNENLPDTPCIIAPNHQSYFDGLFVSMFLKNRHLRKTMYYAKEKHLKQRWLKFIADKHNIIVMDLNKDLKQSIQKMAEALKRGKNIMIFPEGTRSLDGKLGKFKQTFAILSKELNVPVVPVAIKGASDALPKGKRFPRPWKKIKVKFLKPIYPEKLSLDSIKEKVHSKVLSHIK